MVRIPITDNSNEQPADEQPVVDAETASDELNAQRLASEEMEEKQAGGEVDTQTKHAKPSAANPEDGFPADNEIEEETVEASNEQDGGEGDAVREGLARQLLHLTADFENYKRQAARREKEARERANISLIEDLLPVLDNFERALEAAKDAKDIESLKVGVGYIAQQLRETLRNHGVEPIEAHGKIFDPKHHEALEEVSGSGHPEGTVVHEAQRGYKYRGHVLRPSRVRVAGKDEDN